MNSNLMYQCPYDKYKDCIRANTPECDRECARHEGHILMNPKNDMVNHPSHYTDGKIEVIDYIEDKGFNYHLGQAIKYISRAGKKDPDKYTEDLKKAIWYLQREVDRNGK